MHTNPCRRPCRTTATPTSPARSSACTAWWPNPPRAGQGGRPRHRGGGRATPARYPLAAVDVAGRAGPVGPGGAGGRYGEVRYPAIAEWGVPTAQACGGAPDAARDAAGRLGWHPQRHGRRQGHRDGASVVALARPLLAPAIESSGAVLDVLAGFIEELRVCLHGAGAENLAELRARPGSSRSRAGTGPQPPPAFPKVLKKCDVGVTTALIPVRATQRGCDHTKVPHDHHSRRREISVMAAAVAAPAILLVGTGTAQAFEIQIPLAVWGHVGARRRRCPCSDSDRRPQRLVHLPPSRRETRSASPRQPSVSRSTWVRSAT